MLILSYAIAPHHPNPRQSPLFTPQNAIAPTIPPNYDRPLTLLNALACLHGV
ncbi:MAG: hypothetical protein AB4042_13970 [Leptolyngbyaceae cyanobacterium]